jgi:hypothetical protein
VSIDAVDWERMYLDSIRMFGALGLGVLSTVSEGGSLADVVELVGNHLDGRDHIDDEAIALFERAKAAAGAPKVLLHGRVHDVGGGWVSVMVDRDTDHYPAVDSHVIMMEGTSAE